PQRIPLTLTEFRMLAHMARYPMRVFSRAELADACLKGDIVHRLRMPSLGRGHRIGIVLEHPAVERKGAGGAEPKHGQGDQGHARGDAGTQGARGPHGMASRR
ncbi:MAG: hypothetical protein EON88_20195, partial [Brevundimonas sp.]